MEHSAPGEWEMMLTTEDGLFASDAQPIAVDRQPGGVVVQFGRPGAVIMRKR